MSKKSSPREKPPAEAAFSSGAHALSALGKPCEDVVRELLVPATNQPLFSPAQDSQLQHLAQALNLWTDEQERATVIRHYLAAAAGGRVLDTNTVARWIRAHINDAFAVCDCMNVDPPAEVTIVRMLSRAGSQKIVFLANWNLTQRQVVLKRLSGPPETRAARIQREIQAHPLSWVHDNIIETHFLRNPKDEVFLLEEYLPDVLRDDYPAQGILEGANLFYDICNALTFLHEQAGLVHGDVKPDNIGKRGTTYILLDFGICRPKDDFSIDTTATGSLRTRAPELLTMDAYAAPEKADVWAIGATIFNYFAGRFPLIERSERIPRVSNPTDRSSFEQALADRVRTRWDELVDLSLVPEAMRPPLRRALVRDHEARPTARELTAEIEHELPAYLRKYSESGRFSPIEQLRQLSSHLPGKDTLKLLPPGDLQSLRSLLQTIESARSLPTECNAEITSIRERIG
ncbi:Serine/threonine-protein kinase PrkC [Phycisphaerae bacterium RAS1]|nr:Serine/threonine-protein kinase PrkC [Phycisphaerae bacterium RAS1]